MQNALQWQQTRRPSRLGPMIFIILLHIGFFYALWNGLLQLQLMPQTMPPKVVFSSLILPKTETPKPTPPKTVPVAKPVHQPAAPVVHATPSPEAITAPLTASQEPAETPVDATPQPAQPAPPAPATFAQPRVITSGVEYIQEPNATYPVMSRRLGEEGRVILRALVDIHGRSSHVEIQKSSGSARLDEAAKQAVLHALFKPHIENGHPITVYAVVPILFRLDR